MHCRVSSLPTGRKKIKPVKQNFEGKKKVMYSKLYLYYWGVSVYVYVTGTQKIYNRNINDSERSIYFYEKIITKGIAEGGHALVTNASNCDLTELRLLFNH